VNAAKKRKHRSNEAKKALAGKRLNAFAMDPAQLLIVGIDTKDGPEHYLWDVRIKLPVNVALAKNINKNGVLEAVKVRKDGDRTLVVAGRQRVRAARLANEWRDAKGLEPILVPVMLERGGDARMVDVMVSENELRANDNVEAKLSKLERFMSLGRSEEDAAVQFGVEPATIRNWLPLPEAGPAVKRAFTAGLLPATAAIKIAKLPRAEQAKAVADVTKDGKATVAAADRAARSARDPKAAPAIVPPRKRLLKKLCGRGALFALLHSDNDAKDYGDGFREALMWALGDLPTSAIVGLQRAVDALEGVKEQEAAQ
jgi:ParB family chromosome partitioning protein